MQAATMISIGGYTFAMIVFTWQKRWLLSLMVAFGLAYTIFDKVFPTLLPEYVVLGFSICSLVMALIFCWQTFSRKSAS